MTREEALLHFEENCVNPLCAEKLKLLDIHYHNNKDKYSLFFIQSFTSICNKAGIMQKNGAKGKLGILTWSMLRTELCEGSAYYLIDAYDKEWFMDEVECQEIYDASWAFDYLFSLRDELIPLGKLYCGLIFKHDIHNFCLKKASLFNNYIVALAHYAFYKHSAFDHINCVEFEDEFEVRVGEYLDYSECIFTHNFSPANSDEIREWLHEKLPLEYRYMDLSNHNLSNGNYDEIDFRYCNFANSNLSKSSLMFCDCFGVRFNGCDLSYADMSYAELYFADFTKCDLQGACFFAISASAGFLEDSPLNGPSFEGLSFYGANLQNANFKDAEINCANFLEAILIGADFSGANMKDAVFSKEQLKMVVLSDEQINEIRII